MSQKISRRAKKISVVVPVRNSESVLPTFLHELGLVFRELSINYEVVFVDHGSKDHSGHIIREFVKLDDCLKLVTVSEKVDDQSALRIGIEELDSVSDICMVLNIPFSHSNELIKEMLSQWELGNDLVFLEPEKIRSRDFNGLNKKKITQLLSKISANILEPSCNDILFDQSVRKIFLDTNEKLNSLVHLCRYFEKSVSSVKFDAHVEIKQSVLNRVRAFKKKTCSAIRANFLFSPLNPHRKTKVLALFFLILGLSLASLSVLGVGENFALLLVSTLFWVAATGLFSLAKLGDQVMAQKKHEISRKIFVSVVSHESVQARSIQEPMQKPAQRVLSQKATEKSIDERTEERFFFSDEQDGFHSQADEIDNTLLAKKEPVLDHS